MPSLSRTSDVLITNLGPTDISFTRRPRSVSPSVSKRVKDLENKRVHSVMSNNFDKAKKLREAQIQSMRDQELVEKKEEVLRQQKEKEKFEQAASELQRKHKEKWDAKFNEIEQECQQRLQHLNETHSRQMQELLEKIELKKANFKYRFSVDVREMKRNEMALLKSHLYDESKEVHRRLNLKQKEEAQKIQQQQDKICQDMIDRLTQKQEEERKFLLGRIKTMKAKAMIEKEQDEKRMAQQMGNLKRDMEHAHCLEFIQNREVTNQSLSRTHHKDSSSTYAGTLLWKKLTGGKYAIQSLCQTYDNEL